MKIIPEVCLRILH